VKRVETWLLTIGWIGAIVIPIVGIVAGLYISFAHAPGNDGTRRYDAWSRKQAVPMIVVALAIVLLGVVLRAGRR
jgi:O-antigen ligase